MIESFKTILEWLKNGVKTLPPIALSAAFCLFAPAEWLAAIGLDGFADKFKPYIGAAWVLSVAAMLSIIGGLFLAPARKIIVNRSVRRAGIRAVKKLSPDELRILRGYIEGETKTLVLSLLDGNVTSLVNANIIYRASQFGTDIVCFAFNLQPWAWTYLNEHKEILGIHDKHSE